MAGEYARGHVLGGFPWVPLGSSMATVLPVAQLASLFGVYGLSLYLVAHSTLVAVAITGTTRQRVRGGGRCAWPCCSPCRSGAACGCPSAALTREGTPITLGLIQANIRQEEKWDPAMAATIDAALRRADPARGRRWRRRRAVARVGDAVLLQRGASSGPRRSGAWSAKSARRCSSAPTRSNAARPPRYYNSAFMLAPDGAVAAAYRKIKLVPFGEYVPLRSLLFFVTPLVEGVGGFSAGDRVTMLPMAGHMASTAICYEIVYPDLAREAIRQGAELLTTVTNDAWYGDSSAPYQHFALASLRAIEQGRYLARAANTGISGVVDPYGRVIGATGVFEEAVVLAEVRFLTGRTRVCDNRGSRRTDRPGHRRPHRRVAGGRAAAAAPVRQGVNIVALGQDELVRRSEDVVKRANDLRSYL